MTDVDCKKGVAIVEDDAELITVYIKLFKKRGTPVCFIAHNGIEAVHKFSSLKTRPPVIIMDNRMPVMNGVDATKEIMKMEPESRIIFFSADITIKEEAISSGAIAFLHKPVSINMITQTICKALN